ncbi:MAG: hypothetical protein KDK99_09700 [Verrucomicrobiales bacterium]|nr:hypothetical protein [Verrucomicrobiales bacterium]
MKLWKCLVLALSLVPAMSWGQADQVKVQIKGLKVGEQQTPQIQASNIVDKRWRPKNWIEIEVPMEIKLARDLGGRDGSLQSLQIKYFVGVNAKTDDGKNVVLTGTINYQDIAADQDNVALAFVSPSTLKRVLQKDNGGKGDVVAYGVEVMVGSERVAFESSTGSPWWFDQATNGLSDRFAPEDGAILPKSKTPFAPFWGDYDLPVATN